MGKDKSKSVKYKVLLAVIILVTQALYQIYVIIWMPKWCDSVVLFAMPIALNLVFWMSVYGYIDWATQNGKDKSIRNYCMKMGQLLKRVFDWIVAIFVILLLWIGIGVGLICLPLLVDIQGWTWGGILQLMGLCWIVMGYWLITNYKKRK